MITINNMAFDNFTISSSTKTKRIINETTTGRLWHTPRGSHKAFNIALQFVPLEYEDKIQDLVMQESFTLILEDNREYNVAVTSEEIDEGNIIFLEDIDAYVYTEIRFTVEEVVN